jgi:hypothetical protein
VDDLFDAVDTPGKVIDQIWVKGTGAALHVIRSGSASESVSASLREEVRLNLNGA